MAAAPTASAEAPLTSTLFSRRRWVVTTLASAIVFALLNLVWQSSALSLLLRVATIGAVACLAFGAAERWPARLPRRVARWAWQVVLVAVSIPPVVAAFYVYATEPGAPPFWQEQYRLGGFMMLTLLGMLVAPWVAMAALLRQRDALVHEQAMAFANERSQLERRADDARMQLLQAQVQPHFLFNTLANVRALVKTGSAQAPALLDALIAYLRAAVPRVNAAATTLGDELELVRAYLALMQMRMPDRLQHSVHADADLLALPFPPMALLTVVENAVRHGIDPSEDGGRIDVSVSRVGSHCLLRVLDSGVGLRSSGSEQSTGLATLRERLQLAWRGQATLRLMQAQPQGVCAEIELPLESAR